MQSILAATVKTCSKCGKSKPVDTGFYKHIISRGHRRAQCRECICAANRRWSRAHRDQLARLSRAGDLRRLYGLTLAGYEALKEEQKGLCAICGREPSKPLRVDHDHATGVVRGLLCQKCNSAIGLLADDPALVERALTYLRTCRE